MEQNIEPQLIRGNVAIHANEDRPDLYGDGSLEVQGLLYVDRVTGYGSAGTDVQGTLFDDGIVTMSAPTIVPTTAAPQEHGKMYYDAAKHQIWCMDDTGIATQVSGKRLMNKGDLMTSNGLVDTVLSSSAVAAGSCLVSDPTASSGLKWSAVSMTPTATASQSWTFVDPIIHRGTTASNVNMTSNVFSVNLTDDGDYRIGVYFTWSMTAPSQCIYMQVTSDDNVIMQNEIQSGHIGTYRVGVAPPEEKQVEEWCTVLSLDAGEHTFTLQWRMILDSDVKATLLIENVSYELVRLR